MLGYSKSVISKINRINLDSKTVISFEDFFSKFRVVSDLEKGWLYPVARHSSSMPWQFVYSQLQKKARNGYAQIIVSARYALFNFF